MRGRRETRFSWILFLSISKQFLASLHKGVWRSVNGSFTLSFSNIGHSHFISMLLQCFVSETCVSVYCQTWPFVLLYKKAAGSQTGGKWRFHMVIAPVRQSLLLLFFTAIQINILFSLASCSRKMTPILKQEWKLLSYQVIHRYVKTNQ